MLSEIFYWVLNVSIIGGVMGLIVMALGKIKGLPKFAVYLLWSIPLVRFWIPLGVANRYSLLSLISKFTTKTVVVWEDSAWLTISNSVMAAERYFPIVYKTKLLGDIFEIASMVWAIIAAAAILTSVLLYFFTKAELKQAILIRDNIYRSDRIMSPAVYGMIRPKIIIPESIADTDMDYIIKHENVHIKRKDNLLRVIAVITACVHWFNPLVWVFLKGFFADMELSCDTKVLKNIDESQQREYASAILNCAERKEFYVSAFGGASTRVRIKNIISYKKLTLLSSLCFAALILAIVIVLATNAVL